jgi:hypothetical protein
MVIFQPAAGSRFESFPLRHVGSTTAARSSGIRIRIFQPSLYRTAPVAWLASEQLRADQLKRIIAAVVIVVAITTARGLL